MKIIEKNGNIWTITLSQMPADINKFIAKQIKAEGIRVSDPEVQLLVTSEPGRTWIKSAGQTSCVAYG